MCGEKLALPIYLVCLIGSPPRVRGKADDVNLEERIIRITPACAGKSLLCDTEESVPKDHPRVCGEKAPAPARARFRRGSPPRVRGKEYCVTVLPNIHRITPACAGKSA